MGRPFKEGIDYFSHDSDAQEDKKTKLLQAKYGLVGYGLFWKLLEIGYKEKGYYVDLSGDNAEVIAMEVGIKAELLNEIIEFMLYKNLFNADIYSKYKILTSARMQKNYLNGTERRLKISLVKDYLLIDVMAEKGKNHKAEFTIIALNGVNDIRKPSNCNTETTLMIYSSTQSKSKSKREGEEIESKEEQKPETTLEDITPTVDNFSFPTLTEEEDNSSPTTAAKAIFTPKDFQDDAQVKAVVTLMLARYCKEGAADKATVSRFVNIITKTENCVKRGEIVSRKFTHRIMLETFQQYKDFSPETKNLPYLSRAVIGKINDAMIIHKEKNTKTEKDNLGKKTNEMLNSQIDTDVGKEIVRFATDHKMPEPEKKKNVGFMDGITY